MAADVLALSALSVASTDYKNVLQSGSFELDSEAVRNDSVIDGAQSNQTQKIMCRITAALMSSLTAPDRVSDLDLSALTLDGVDLLAYGLGSLRVNGSYGRADRPNGGSIFKFPQNTTKALAGSVQVAAPDTGVLPFFNAIGSTDPDDKVVELSYTINSITTTFPVLLKSASVPYERDGLQIVDIAWESRKPTSGAYPSAPTGTTSLYEKALNAYKTAVAIVADSAVAGTRISGNFIFDSWSLEVSDGQLLPITYNWLSRDFSVATIV